MYKHNNSHKTDSNMLSTLFLHGVCMLRECIYGECAHEQPLRRTLTITHTITAYSVSGKVRILSCATRQKPCRKRVYPNMHMSKPKRAVIASITQ